MQKSKKLYHLHIPRTSGTGILYAINNSFKIHKSKTNTNSFKPPEIFQFVYDHDVMQFWPLISGHFAINPIIENKENIDVFSIVRNPIDHFISIAAYRAMSSQEQFDNLFLDKFIEGEYDLPIGCDLFSSRGNLQTKMLTCKSVSIAQFMGEEFIKGRKDKSIKYGIWFVNSDMPKNQKELIEKIKTFKLFEINQRKEINKYLKYQLKEKFDVDFIQLNDFEKTNSSVRNNVKPSPLQEKEILKRNEMDLILYEYVQSRTNKHPEQQHEQNI